MRIMVTGSMGYIGVVLVPLLKQKGHAVTGMDTGFFGRKYVGSPAAEPERILDMDIRQSALEHFKGLDAVIHLANLSNDPMGELDPGLTEEINHQASVRLGRLAKEAGVKRFVFASSCSLYGAADLSRPLDETASFNPVSAYAHAKVNTENGLRALADDGFSPVFLRNSTVYGLSPSMRFDLVANNLVGWALTAGEIKLMSDGSPWRPMVHVRDVALACLSAVEAPKEAVHNQAFNIGRDDQNFQVRDIAEAVGRAVPGCQIVFAEDAGPDTRSYKVSFAKAAQGLPGFKPSWTLDAGVKEMVDFFQGKGLATAQFQGPPAIRLAQLKVLLENGELDQKLYWTKKGA